MSADNQDDFSHMTMQQEPIKMTNAELLAEIALLRSDAYRADSRRAVSRVHREWLVRLVAEARIRKLGGI